jgi:hypothetical protein
MTGEKRRLCLALACVLTASIAASAHAGTYEWCRTHKHGKYSDAGCTKLDEPNGKAKGHFEREPVMACAPQKKGEFADSSCTTKSLRPHKGRFEQTTGRAFTISGGTTVGYTPSVGGFAVVCSHLTGAGEVIAPKESRETLTFTGCEQDGQECASGGQPAGVIQTLVVDAKLIDHGEKGPLGDEPGNGEAWTELAGTPQNGGLMAEFGCAIGDSFTLFGTASAVTTGNLDVLGNTSAVKLEVGLGEQNLMDTISGSGPFAATLTGELSVTYASQVEIKT